MRCFPCFIATVSFFLAAFAQDRVLETLGLSATVDSLRPALRVLVAGSDERRQLRADFSALGAPQFAARKAAFTSLKSRPLLPGTLLRSSLASEDPEIRAWADQLAFSTVQRNQTTLQSILRRIERIPVLGLSQDLYIIGRAYEAKPAVSRPCYRSALQSLLPSDETWIARALSETNQSPAFLLAAVARLNTPALQAAAQPYLTDPDPELRMLAVRAALQAGDRRALPALLELLESPRFERRRQAHQLLCEVSGLSVSEQTQVAASDAKGEVAHWRSWVEQFPAEASLLIPDLETAPALLHRFVVALWNSGEVLEFNEDGQLIWRVEVKQATCVEGLPNGHRLVVGHTDQILEFSADGTLLKELKPETSPIYIQRLPSGDTVVGFEKEVITYGPEWHIQGRFALPRRAWFCTRRLANGHSLITYIDRFGVAEVDAAGEEVRFVAGEKRFRDAQLLENGHFLVCELDGRVLEYKPDGTMVWQSAADLNPVRAERLTNGDTRVYCKNGILDITVNGTLIPRLQIELDHVPNGASFY